MGLQFIRDFSNFLLDFTFYYPLFMAYVWMTGAINYYFRYERATADQKRPEKGSYTAPVTVIIPMRNEEANAKETIAHVMSMDYPEFEVIAVDDGSTDRTGALLDGLLDTHARLRVVHLAQNQGKAIALEMGTLIAQHEFVVCIDGDAVLDPQAAFLGPAGGRCDGQSAHPYALDPAGQDPGRGVFRDRRTHQARAADLRPALHRVGCRHHVPQDRPPRRWLLEPGHAH